MTRGDVTHMAAPCCPKHSHRQRPTRGPCGARGPGNRWTAPTRARPRGRSLPSFRPSCREGRPSRPANDNLVGRRSSNVERAGVQDEPVSSLLKSVAVRCPATGRRDKEQASSFALLAGGGGRMFCSAAVRSIITFTDSLWNKLLPV